MAKKSFASDGDSGWEQEVRAQIEKIIKNFPELNGKEIWEQMLPALEKIVRSKPEKQNKKLETVSIVNRALIKMKNTENFPLDVYQFWAMLNKNVQRALVDKNRETHGRKGDRPKHLPFLDESPAAEQDDDTIFCKLDAKLYAARDPAVRSLELDAFEEVKAIDPDGALILEMKQLGMSRDEIATNLGITTSQVRTREENFVKKCRERRACM